MPKDIQFSEVEPRYLFERDCLVFPARMDGKPVECLVTFELLMARFGAREFSEEAMRQVYQENREAIQAIARDHIEKGWIDDEGRIILTTRFTRLTARFERPLANDPAVAAAHRTLTEIIGPQASEVVVEWRLHGLSDPRQAAQPDTLRGIDMIEEVIRMAGIPGLPFTIRHLSTFKLRAQGAVGYSSSRSEVRRIFCWQNGFGLASIPKMRDLPD